MTPARKAAVEAELGDLLFTVVNLGRHLGVDAEMALRGCNLRFRRALSSKWNWTPTRPLEELPPDELEALWIQAKAQTGHGESLPRPAVRAPQTSPRRSAAMILIRNCSGFDEIGSLRPNSD